MKSQVLLTVWCNISGGAGGEIWHWSLSGVKGLKTPNDECAVIKSFILERWKHPLLASENLGTNGKTECSLSAFKHSFFSTGLWQRVADAKRKTQSGLGSRFPERAGSALWTLTRALQWNDHYKYNNSVTQARYFKGVNSISPGALGCGICCHAIRSSGLVWHGGITGRFRVRCGTGFMIVSLPSFT